MSESLKAEMHCATSEVCVTQHFCQQSVSVFTQAYCSNIRFTDDRSRKYGILVGADS